MAKGGAYFVRGTQNEICNLGGEWKCTAGSKTGQKVLRGTESGAVGSALCTCPRCLLVRGAESPHPPPRRAERCEPVGVLQQSLCL